MAGLFGAASSGSLIADVTDESGPAIPKVPTLLEAREMVLEEMANRAQKERNRAAALLQPPALGEWHENMLSGPWVLRQIPPPARAHGTPARAPVPRASPSIVIPGHEGRDVTGTIALSAWVIDHSITRISWRDTEGGEWLILSNVDFNHLSGVSRLDEGDRSWMTLVFVVNRAAIAERLDVALSGRSEDLDLALKLFSQDHFTTDEPQYVVFAGSEQEVPGRLFEEMDALHEYYARNRENLIAAHQRRQALHEARRELLETNPPPRERTTITNFWIRP